VQIKKIIDNIDAINTSITTDITQSSLLILAKNTKDLEDQLQQLRSKPEEVESLVQKFTDQVCEVVNLQQRIGQLIKKLMI